MPKIKPASSNKYATDADASLEPLSKTRKKQQMQELQDLGEELADLPSDWLKKIDIPENLRDALFEAQRMSSHGAKRRQLQYVGKVMRDLEAEPIRAALANLRGESAVEVARMHRLERLRTRLMEDEQALSDIANTFPDADLQHLRALRRSALKEQEGQKPPRSYRAIFQTLKDLEAGTLAVQNANDGNENGND
jgi:ribosome-associated protein